MTGWSRPDPCTCILCLSKPRPRCEQKSCLLINTMISIEFDEKHLDRQYLEGTDGLNKTVP
jgi:hypothetical protein